MFISTPYFLQFYVRVELHLKLYFEFLKTNIISYYLRVELHLKLYFEYIKTNIISY
jgi:hypothetical protein